MNLKIVKKYRDFLYYRELRMLCFLFHSVVCWERSQLRWRFSFRKWCCLVYTYLKAPPPEMVSCPVYSFESALNQHPIKSPHDDWLPLTLTIKKLTTALRSCFLHAHIIEMHTLSNSKQGAIIENSKYPAMVVITVSIWVRSWENVGLWSGLLCQHCCITVL